MSNEAAAAAAQQSSADGGEQGSKSASCSSQPLGAFFSLGSLEEAEAEKRSEF